jgi:hypothetical protein
MGEDAQDELAPLRGAAGGRQGRAEARLCWLNALSAC